LITYVAIVLTMIMAILSLRAISQPGIAFAMMWSLYASEQILQLGHPIFIRFGFLLNIGFTIVALAAVVNGIRRGAYQQFKLPPELWWCIGLFSVAICSYLWSIEPQTTLTYLKKSAPYVGAFLLIMPLCAADEKQLRLAVNLTVYLGTFILIGHSVGTYGRRSLVLISSASGDIESNPLAVASYGGIVGICSLFSVYGRKFSPMFAFKVAVFFLSAYVIIKSASRGQLLALVVVCFVWLPIIARATLKRSTVIAFIGSAIIAGIALYVVYQLKDTGRWRSEQIEVAQEGRMLLITSLLEYWYNSGFGAWLLGTGSSTSYDIVGFYPHNIPVEVLAEEGIFGFIMYTGFAFCVLLRSGRLMFSSNLNVETRINLGILLAVFCFEGILTLKQGSMLGSTNWFAVGITIGWVTNSLIKQTKLTAQRKRQYQWHQAQMHFLHSQGQN